MIHRPQQTENIGWWRWSPMILMMTDHDSKFYSCILQILLKVESKAINFGYPTKSFFELYAPLAFFIINGHGHTFLSCSLTDWLFCLTRYFTSILFLSIKIITVFAVVVSLIVCIAHTCAANQLLPCYPHVSPFVRQKAFLLDLIFLSTASKLPLRLRFVIVKILSSSFSLGSSLLIIS